VPARCSIATHRPQRGSGRRTRAPPRVLDRIAEAAWLWRRLYSIAGEDLSVSDLKRSPAKQFASLIGSRKHWLRPPPLLINSARMALATGPMGPPAFR